jgi:hypothetical protein
VDLILEDIWHRKFGRRTSQWWQGSPTTDHFFANGLLSFDEFARGGGPSFQWQPRSVERKVSVPFWAMLAMRLYLYGQRRRFRPPLKRLRSMAITWAAMQLQPSADIANFRIRSLNFRTLWVARQLEVYLGWQPRIDPDAGVAPTWLKWPQANGSEPLLDTSAFMT